MKDHHLNFLFNPSSIAVIGASDQAQTLGQIVFSNLLAADYRGKLFPINVRHKSVGGLPAVNSVLKIKEPVDLAIVLTPINTYLNIIQECAQKGIKGILLNNGAKVASRQEQKVFEQALLLAQEKKIRILGPSFLGMLRPASNINASSYACQMHSGSLALVTQSSSLATAIIDWADRKEIGFSSLISVDGAETDVTFSDILDFLANDTATEAILLHIHTVHDGRKFMTALRSVAREKPVVVIKSGLFENDIVGQTLCSQIVNSHEVFQSALSRAGVLHIDTISEIFTSINALSNNFKITDKRLAILSNGIGVGMLAADRALRLGVDLAPLANDTLTELNHLLPIKHAEKEPIDLLDNASPLRFKSVAKLCIDDKNVDGVLVILTPQMGTDHLTTARLMIDLQKQTKKPLFLSWLGETKVNDSYDLFSKAHSACFRMPEHAIEAFNTLANYQRNQKLLSQIPVAQEHYVEPDIPLAKKIIDSTLKNFGNIMPEHLAQELLAAFHIATAQSKLAQNFEEAKTIALTMTYPLMLKIDATQMVGMVDVEEYGVIANHQDELESLFNQLTDLAKKTFSQQGTFLGINIQPVVAKRANQEVMIGVTQDPKFGPIISFGENVFSSESRPNHAVALPPLNDFLAQDLIARTYIGKNTNLPKSKQLVNHKALKAVLLSLSKMVCAFPQIKEICLNSVWVDDKSVYVPNVRIVVQKVGKLSKRLNHMAIMPYPDYVSMAHKLPNGTNVTIRAIRPEDATMLQNLVKNLSEESRYNRYLSNIKQLPQNTLARFSQLDYDKEMAIVMVYQNSAGQEEMLGVARYTAEPDNESCEFAVEVADDWQGNGIATILMHKLFIAAKEQGLKVMRGEVLSTNENMKKFMKKLGFSIKKLPEDHNLLLVEKNLSAVTDAIAKANLLAARVFRKS
ncbi:GNAT family N-acetyltransferase [Neisseria sp. Ec49-e6-T10]|uniref:bifunctional acetate--CoA ligase family protein/GNAT family N-acetyltransferase n=1 Tax=Neisseria sp. Ec49-e6-T10 TaxID=3140744 RepID=UPI003EBB6762